MPSQPDFGPLTLFDLRGVHRHLRSQLVVEANPPPTKGRAVEFSSHGTRPELLATIGKIMARLSRSALILHVL